jgi:type II secretion system protein J
MKIKGFTLLELLLAVTIFSVIAVVLIASFNAGIKILRRSEVAMRHHQALRFALDEVALDLRNALLTELPEDSGGAETEDEEEGPVNYFKGKRTEFEFITLKDVYRDDGPAREVCKARYYLKEGGQSAFMRSISLQSSGYSEGENGGETLLTGMISGMEVAYSYEPADEDGPPEWYDYWELSEAIPAGIKIKFKLKGLGPLKEFTKTIFIETGVLGSFDEDEGAV